MRTKQNTETDIDVRTAARNSANGNGTIVAMVAVGLAVFALAGFAVSRLGPKEMTQSKPAAAKEWKQEATSLLSVPVGMELWRIPDCPLFAYDRMTGEWDKSRGLQPSGFCKDNVDTSTHKDGSLNSATIYGTPQFENFYYKLGAFVVDGKIAQVQLSTDLSNYDKLKEIVFAKFGEPTSTVEDSSSKGMYWEGKQTELILDNDGKAVLALLYHPLLKQAKASRTAEAQKDKL
jgi:hypothetical protein